jgi:hypothetical protein
MHIFVRVVLAMVIGIRMAVLYAALRAASPPREPLVYRQKTAATYRVIRGKRKRVERVHAGIEVPDRVRFRLQPETGFDRGAKRLGLATEWQVNDREFDDSIFVVSDDPLFRRCLWVEAQSAQDNGAFARNRRTCSSNCLDGMGQHSRSLARCRVDTVRRIGGAWHCRHRRIHLQRREWREPAAAVCQHRTVDNGAAAKTITWS